MLLKTTIRLFGTIIFEKVIKIVHRANILEVNEPVTISLATYLVREMKIKCVLSRVVCV